MFAQEAKLELDVYVHPLLAFEFAQDQMQQEVARILADSEKTNDLTAEVCDDESREQTEENRTLSLLRASMFEAVDFDYSILRSVFLRNAKMPDYYRNKLRQILTRSDRFDYSAPLALLTVDLENSPVLLSRLQAIAQTVINGVLEQAEEDYRLELLEPELVIEEVEYRYAEGPSEFREQLFFRFGFRMQKDGKPMMGEQPIYANIPVRIHARIEGFDRPAFEGEAQPPPSIVFELEILSPKTSHSNGELTYFSGEARRISPLKYWVWSRFEKQIEKFLPGQRFSLRQDYPENIDASGHTISPPILLKEEGSRGVIAIPYHSK